MEMKLQDITQKFNKMIVILSQENDRSTDDVIDWIYSEKVPFLRINSGDLYFKNFININSTEANFVALPFDLNAVSIVWLRRFHNIDQYCEKIYDENEISAIFNVKKHLSYEANAISNYFLTFLKKKKWLTSPIQSHNDKIHTLYCAKSLGLDIPETLVTSDLSELSNFQRRHETLISKPLSNTENFFFNKKIYSNYTSLVSKKTISESKKIPLTLFQENLVKDFEIRVFYLMGKCYSMAIFSQSDEQTKVDFRVYNFENPNRVTPFKLPKNTEVAIKKLMKKLKLETGSLDFIKTTDDRLVFLEVNPVGQFGMVSSPCNYYLEKKIAEYLIKQN